MSYDDDNDELDEVTQPQPLDPNIRKQLREAEKLRKELASAQAELDAQRREIQFSKAGIPDTGLGELFRKAYDGSVEPDAIRKAAEEYGILQATQVYDNSAEIEALRRAQGATVGTTGLVPDAAQEYQAAIAAATTPDEILSIIEGDLGRKLGVNSTRLH